jgi:cell division transport system permease protein
MNSLFVGWAQENLPFFPISSGAVNALIILLFLLFVGALVGVAGSFFSVRRFLKV